VYAYGRSLGGPGAVSERSWRRFLPFLERLAAVLGHLGTVWGPFWVAGEPTSVIPQTFFTDLCKINDLSKHYHPSQS